MLGIDRPFTLLPQTSSVGGNKTNLRHIVESIQLPIDGEVSCCPFHERNPINLAH